MEYFSEFLNYNLIRYMHMHVHLQEMLREEPQQEEPHLRTQVKS